MAKLNDGSWYQVIQLYTTQARPGTAWSLFYEGKSLVQARRRMATLRAVIAQDGGELKPFYNGEPTTARVELRLVQNEGASNDYSNPTILDVYDAWQSATLAVYAPIQAAPPAPASLQEPTAKEGDCPPFAPQDVVRIKSGPDARYGHMLVTGCQNYGTAALPNWALDGQKLTPHTFRPDTLVLSPTRLYMVPAFDCVRALVEWTRDA